MQTSQKNNNATKR